MAYTQADLDAIEAEIASADKMVQFADRAVTKRSMDELLLAREQILRGMATPRRKQIIGIPSKGL